MFFLKKLSVNQKIILLLLIIVTLNYFFFNYRLIFRQNAYIAGDWLLNYQGGFVRRGFFGEIIFRIANYFKISILLITYIASSFFFFAFVIIYYQCINKYLTSKFLLIYLLLPSTLLFTFFDPLAIGRKESLVLFFISLYTLLLTHNLISKFFIQLILAFLILITTLTHEIMFFFVPYLFAIKFFFYNQKFILATLKLFYFEFLLLFISFISVLFIFLFSHLHDHNLLCKSLLNLNLNESICGAVIPVYKDKQTFSFIFPYFFERNYFRTYGLVTILNFLPIFSYFFFQEQTIKIKSTKFFYIIFTLICFFFTLPIFLIVNDWGRYLNIHFINHGLLFAFILKNHSDIFKIQFNKQFIFKKLLIAVVIFFYITSWFMPHCCRTDIGDGYKSIYNRISFRLLDDSNETLKYGVDYPRLIFRKILNLN
jgi:hypothetical protein